MHKTGTTALQTALKSARDKLARAHVSVPNGVNTHHAAKSLTGMGSGWYPSDGVPTERATWQKLVHEVRSASGRVVISSEYLSRANPEHIRQLADDLGAERVYALVGIRNLVPVARSSWQQFLKVRRTIDLDGWLRRYFDSNNSDDGAGLLDGQDPGITVQRWSQVLGPERITAVVIREGDRELLPSTVEQLLDLVPGLLSERIDRKTNRGMTEPEAELTRQVNRALGRELDWERYSSLIRYGMVTSLLEQREPGQYESLPRLPEWAVRRAISEGERVAREVRECGVRVVGDLGQLTQHFDARSAAQQAKPATVPIDAAVAAIVGVAKAAGKELERAQSVGKQPRIPGGRTTRWRQVARRLRRWARRGSTPTLLGLGCGR